MHIYWLVIHRAAKKAYFDAPFRAEIDEVLVQEIVHNSSHSIFVIGFAIAENQTLEES